MILHVAVGVDLAAAFVGTSKLHVVEDAAREAVHLLEKIFGYITKSITVALVGTLILSHLDTF